MAPLLTIDKIWELLDRLPLSVPGATIIALSSFRRSQKAAGSITDFKEHVLRTPWLYYLLCFVALKSVNRILTRLVRNHGWQADPPVWSKGSGKGDVVLITGGSTGIGKEMVEILAKKTDKIAVLDLATPTYNAPNVKFYKCDITDPDAIAKVAVQVRKDIGHPTVLVNNAGIARGNTILNTTADQFLLTYKVNVLGAHNILREFLPYIVSKNHGHVMTTASSAAYMSISQLSEYACSKAAVLALHETLNQELVHRYNAPKVRTSVICPMKVSTQMGDAMKEQDNQFTFPTLDATELAQQMVAIIESGLSDHLITPLMAHVGLPAIRSLPEWYRWGVNTLGKTHETITDAGNAKQAKVYKLVEELDKKHGVRSNS